MAISNFRTLIGSSKYHHTCSHFRVSTLPGPPVLLSTDEHSSAPVYGVFAGEAGWN